jgi:Cd2+/Zn2+-exporting ATPase
MSELPALDSCDCCPTDGAPAKVVREGLPRDALTATIISGTAVGLGFILQGLPATLAFGAAIAAGGWLVLPKAWKSLRGGALDMNVLMVVAVLGAAAIGQWAEAAAVMALFALAQLLERGAMGRARNAIAGLMEVAPAQALVQRDGGEVAVPVERVMVGELVLVKPGQRIPLDGVVMGGDSAVNEAPITGEAMPVEKSTGSEVFAGSLNGHGALHVRVTSAARDTLLARIGRAVLAAQASRAPIQTFVERFARVYTPAVVLLALVVAVVPPLTTSAEWGTWVYRALALLIIACPCALVISTPVTVVSGLTGAARDGVLLRGGDALERLASITVVAFDKTGTLTEGRPVLTDLAPLDGSDSIGLLRMAAGIERSSEHPLAHAIVAAAREASLEVPASSGFFALPGRGARAILDGRELFLGSRRICDELGTCNIDAHEAMDRFAAEGKTAVLLSSAHESVGVLAVADRVRPEAATCLAELRRLGVRRTVLLTGDSAPAAERVVRQLGLDECRASLLPEEKLAAVHQLRAGGARVALVGDGINDAPALAAADVGVAMGIAGSHVALETADVALMADDLSRLPAAIGRARRTMAIVRQNVAFALGIKAAFLLLAVFGQATLWMAVAADTGASLAVIANGLRALRAPKGVAQ